MEANPGLSEDDDAGGALLREDVGDGCRWTLPSDGVAIGRASRIVSTFAALLFLAGVGVLFATPVLGNDNVVRLLTTAWITAIILALAAAHWRSIAGEPLVLEVQPDFVQIHNPAYLWGRTRRWPTGRVRKLVVAHRGKSLLTGRAVGNLSLILRVRSCGLFFGLDIAELQDVAERVHAIAGIKVKG